MFLKRKVQKGETEQEGNDKKRLYELIEKYKTQTLELNEARELEGILEHEQKKREQKGDTTSVIYIGIILLGVTAYIAKMVMDSEKKKENGSENSKKRVLELFEKYNKNKTLELNEAYELRELLVKEKTKREEEEDLGGALLVLNLLLNVLGLIGKMERDSEKEAKEGKEIRGAGQTI